MERHAILYLTEKQLEVIRLRDEEKLTFTEIGNRIGITGGRARQIYITAIRKRKGIEEIDRNGPNVKFRDLAARNLPTATWHSLMVKHKLDSKEIFLSMTDEDILNLRNVGFKGRLEIQKFMKMLGKDIESEQFPFNDEDIDPEMLEIVKNFNRAEVETLFCCQGHFKYSIDSEQGMSIPYLSTRFPKNERVLLALIRSQVKYPMLNIVIDFAMPYTPNLEEYCEPDEYIKRIDNALNNVEGGHIDIRVNPIFYNLAEEIYNNEEYYERVFEHLRKRFISDLSKLSEDILRIYRSNK